MIVCSCPGCNQGFEVRAVHGGQAPCPHCGQAVSIQEAPIEAVAVAVAPAAPASLLFPPGPGPLSDSGLSAGNAPEIHKARVAPAKGDSAEEPWAFLAPPQAAGELGRLGPFRVLRVLGIGGMGVV